MQNYLTAAPLYSQQFAEVWQWREWAQEQGLEQTDVGIDLVALTHDGEYCAVQCKFYDAAYNLQKSDIDSFFTASGKTWNGIASWRSVTRRTAPPASSRKRKNGHISPGSTTRTSYGPKNACI